MLIPNFSVFFEEVVFELTLRDEEAGACRSFTREGIACPEQEGSEMRRGGSKPHRVHQSGEATGTFQAGVTSAWCLKRWLGQCGRGLRAP